jgi:hypothetical protein
MSNNMRLSFVFSDVILRRIALLAVVVVLAGGAGLGLSELRRARADQTNNEPASEAAAAPTATTAPKWYTRSLALPPDVAPWSIRISPKGDAVAVLAPRDAHVAPTCSDKVAGCAPPPPTHVRRYSLSDPPGAITATLALEADVPYNGGSAWLRDGGLAVADLDTTPQAKAGPKMVNVIVIEPGGATTALGKTEGGSVPSLPLSPDGRWLAAVETGGVRFIDRRTGSSTTVDVGLAGLPFTNSGWAADGRLLVGKDSTLLRIATTGAIDRVDGPAGARLAGIHSISPDGTTALFRAIRPNIEWHSAFVDGRWIDPPSTLVHPVTWLTGHDLLLRTASGQLQGHDARTGKIRDLGFTLRAADPRILAYSEPYLMWRDGDAGRIHLLDTRSAYDVLVGVTDVTGVQAYAGGGFLVLHKDAAELVTGADWFARVPPTAAPFTSAAPVKPGTRDPFADIPALPRMDQLTTGGALDVESRAGATKRVRSPDGGWSIAIPDDWRADVGRLRGGELYSYDPTAMDFSGNAPPAGGVRMSIMLWPDYERRGPAWHADHEGQPHPGMERERATLSIAGMTVERSIARENHPPPFDVTVARWFLRHPSFDDRVFEIVLFRADSAAVSAAEPAISTLRLFTPVSGPREPLLTRTEVMARVVGPASNAKPTPVPSVPERIEAKLVTAKEYELAQNSGRNFAYDADTPLWIVVRFGDYPPSPRSMRGPGPFPNWTWQFAIIDARSGFGYGGGGGTAVSEPTWWSALRDRGL